MTTTEVKIIEALENKMRELEAYDNSMQELANKKLELAKIQTHDYWKKEYEDRAAWALAHQRHGYAFVNEWLNVISYAMYDRLDNEWHSASCGTKWSSGKPAHVTSELNNHEQKIVCQVFKNLVSKKYIRLSKSGKMATYTK